MDNDRKTVLVSGDSVAAYAEPRFVLEFDGKIYVTLAVLEYDPGDEAEMDDDEKSDLAELRAMLGGSRVVSGTLYGAPGEEAAIAQSEVDDR